METSGEDIRFEWIDLYRKHSAAHGLAANYQTAQAGNTGARTLSNEERFSANSTIGPRRMAAWGEFHELIGSLAERERAIVDLLWNQGLKQQSAAELLGVDGDG